MADFSDIEFAAVQFVPHFWGNLMFCSLYCSTIPKKSLKSKKMESYTHEAEKNEMYDCLSKVLSISVLFPSCHRDYISPHNETLHQYVYCSFPHTKATYCAVCKKLLRLVRYRFYKILRLLQCCYVVILLVSSFL